VTTRRQLLVALGASTLIVPPWGHPVNPRRAFVHAIAVALIAPVVIE
jgi:hypothetical protein